MKSDIEIARSVELKKIKQVAESIGIPREEVENYGVPLFLKKTFSSGLSFISY